MLTFINLCCLTFGGMELMAFPATIILDALLIIPFEGIAAIDGGIGPVGRLIRHIFRIIRRNTCMYYGKHAKKPVK